MWSVSQVAEIFNVSPHTVRSWDSKGILRPEWVSPTGRRFYSEEEVSTLFERCRQEGGEKHE